MSSFILPDVKVCSLVHYLSNAARGVHDTLGDLGYRLVTEEDRKKLIVDLLQMNLDAVNCRYGENNILDTEKINFNYEYLSRLQAIKGMRCLLYQCNEGTVSEAPLFKAIDRIANNLMYDVISELPEYMKVVGG